MNEIYHLIRHRTRNKVLTEEQKELAISLRKEKYTYKEISIKLNCELYLINHLCKNVLKKFVSGENKEKKERCYLIRYRYNNGESELELSNAFKLSITSINQIINNKIFYDENYVKRESVKKFTVQDVVNIRKRYESGEDVYTIASDYKDKIKSHVVTAVRQICNHKKFKKI